MNETIQKPEPSPPAEPESHPLTLGQVGMWVFISSEIMLFAALISVALVFRLSTVETGWPNPREMHASLTLGMLNTVFLVISGVTAFSAVKFARANQTATAKLLLTLTILLGMLFLGIKSWEYAKKYRLGLLPSPYRQQIFEESSRQYVSAVDERLQTLIADMEHRSSTETLSKADAELLEILYTLKSYMSGYTANMVGRGNDEYMAQVLMRLMADMIFRSTEPTQSVQEIMALDLANLLARRDRFATRLQLVQQRVGEVKKQIGSLEQSVQEMTLLGTSDSGGDTLEADPEKWLEVKRDQFDQLNIENEKLELVLQPIVGRIQVLDYLQDSRFDDGFNAALGVRLPVVITNGQAWVNVFLLLTGIHALHLIAGLLAFFWFWPRSLDEFRAPQLYVAAMYWQFVDIVWLALFWLIYF